MLGEVFWGREEGALSLVYTNPISRQRLRLMSDEAVLKTHYFIFY